MSIFIWRLIANRVPVDAKLQWRHIELASKCRCCKKPNIETCEHLFIHGEAARKIWTHFAEWFGDIPPFPDGVTEIEQRIRWWHANMGRLKGDHVSILIPCMVLWFIWTERNDVIHREVKFNPEMVKERIHNHLHWAIWARTLEASQWKGVEPKVNFTFPRPRTNRAWQSAIIRWALPQPNWVKLNTDGAYDRSNNQAGGEGVIRNEQGWILEGFMNYFEAASSTEAELRALLLGIIRARKYGRNVWVEVDSQEVASILERGDRGPAEFRHIITGNRNNIKGCQFKIIHIRREGNKIADYLAKEGGRLRNRTTFNQEEAPPLIKALARLDALGLPNFREND